MTLRHPEWQLQVAKARFSEVFNLARSHGPQRITRHGKEAVVVIAVEEFERLVRREKYHGNLADLMADSPLKGMDLDLERVPDYGREVDL